MKTWNHILIKAIMIFSLACFAIKGNTQVLDSVPRSQQSPGREVLITDLRGITQSGFNFWQDKFTGHFAGIDIGLNSLINPDYSDYSPEYGDFMDNDFIRSNSLYINLVQQSIGLLRNQNTFGLVTGIGLHFQSYRLNRNTTIKKSMSNRIYPETLFYDENQKSKFSLVYIDVPLLFEYQIPIKHYANRLYISGGLFGSARISSHTKIKYREDREKEKLKTPDDFSLNNFKCGIMIRSGYRWINIFATYDIVPLFINGKGPVMYPLVVGFTLMSF